MMTIEERSGRLRKYEDMVCTNWKRATDLRIALDWCVTEIERLDGLVRFQREQNDRLTQSIKNMAPDLFRRDPAALERLMGK